MSIEERNRSYEELLQEIEKLREQLREAKETLNAIRSGEVDALVVSGAQGEQIFTLKGAEHPYRVFIEEMKEGAVTLTADDTILYCNSGFARILRTPLEKVIGTGILQFVFPGSRQVFQSLLEQGRAGNSNGEINLLAGDELPVPVYLSINSLKIENEHVVYVVFTDLTEIKKKEDALQRAHDELEIRAKERTFELAEANKSLQVEIEERRMAEKALEESEERMKLALERTDEGIWEWDMISGKVTYDDNWSDILGYAPGEIEFDFDWWEKNVHPDSKPVFEKALTDYLEGREKYYELEYRLRQKSGEWRWIWARGMCNAYDENGKPLRMIGTHRDITSRKNAENALKASEERYRSLFELTKDGITGSGPDGKLIFVNPSAASILGYDDADEMPGMQASDLYAEDKERKAFISELMEKGYTREHELVRKKKDGTPVYVLESAVVHKDQEGNVVLLEGTFKDITERKKAEEKVRNIFSNITERVKELNCLFGVSRLIAELDMSLDEIFQETVDLIPPSWEYPEKTCARIIFKDREFTTENFKETKWKHEADIIASGKKVGVLEVNYLEEIPEAKEGPYIREEKKLVDTLSSLLGNIIERKQFEEALEKANTLLEITFSSLDEAVFVIDPETRNIVSCNEAVERIFGHSKAEILGRNTEFLHVNRSKYEKFGKELFHALDDKGMLQMEYQMRRKNGEVFSSEHIVKEMLDDQGRRVGVLSVVRDITERKKMEEINNEKERLAYSNKIKSEFLTIMSHELRTPLTSIIGYSILLKEKKQGTLNEKQQVYVDNILNGSNHLLGLISSILDVARMEAGKLDLIIEKVSIPDVMNETLDLIKEKARVRNVVLKKEIDPGLDIIEADRQKFKQILFNLLNNALKFSKEEGGTVTVAVKKENNMAQISVSDTGIGIKKKDIKKLFRRFEQLDMGLARKYGGAGLGLSISKQLVEMHGGKIVANSKYGEGSTFTFSLPVLAKKKELEVKDTN